MIASSALVETCDVAEIFALLAVQRAGHRIAEEMGEADDVGERRAQFVGDVVHEVDLDLVGVLQRLVALAQRALDIDRVGDVLEGDQRRAVRQRHGGAVDHAAVAPLDPARHRLAVVDRGDGRAQLCQIGLSPVSARHQRDHALDMRPLGERCSDRASTCARRPD